MRRHFTATAVIVDAGRVLLLEHRKLGVWLPPGGHIDADEDPEQAVRREVREEVGLEVHILCDERPTHPAVTTVPTPYTIQVEDIPGRPGDPAHQHIDLVYVCTPAGVATTTAIEYDSWRWVPIGEVQDLDTPPELPTLVASCADYAHQRQATTAGLAFLPPKSGA